MPTPLDLCGNGLTRVRGVTRDRDQQRRAIFLSDRAVEWLRESLPRMETDGFVDGALTPRHQVADLFRRFIVGDSFADEYAPKTLTPLDKAVVELRTPDVRVFGWFYRQREFIVCSACRKVNLAKKSVTYSGYVSEVCHFRDSLDLDGRKYITGELDDILRL